MLILLISVLLVSGLVVLAARSQDQVATESSIHLTRSVLKDIEQRLADQLLDYSYWDQAVDNLVVKFDADWADNNVGIYMHDNFDISSSYVLDAGNRPVYGMSEGVRSATNPLTRFTGGLDILVERTRSAPRTSPPVPAIGYLSDGRFIHIAAVSVLTTFQPTAGAKTEIATDRILMFTKALDSKLLDTLSRKYLLNDLRLVRDGADPGATKLSLHTVEGSLLGHLHWRLEMPGTKMLAWVLPVVGILFAILIGLTVALIRRARNVIQAYFQEIADRKDAERELERSEILAHARKMEALGSMVGGITHNFNNLLTPILAWSWQIKESLPEGSKERTNLEKVVEASERARDIVAGIMAFARKNPPQKKSIDIGNAIDDSLALVRSTVPSNIELKEHLDPGVGTVLADQAQLQSIILNLISNSVDALEGRNGNISVSLSRIQVDADTLETKPALEPGSYAKIMIADDGKGMDEQTMARIFDPFFTTKKHAMGTGLGLSSAFGIVNEHGGRMHVTSNQDAGTVFDVYLPLMAAGSAP